MCFRLLLKSTTLDDLEQPYPTRLHKRLSELTTEISKRIDALLLAAKCTRGFVLDGIKFVRIFLGVYWRGASNDSEVVRTGDV